MDFSKIRVLVLDGGGRQTLTIIHGLRKIGCEISVVCEKKSDVCYVSRIPDEKMIINKSVPYDQYILSLVKTEKYDVLMPIGDISTDCVTSHEDELKKYVKLACAPRSAFDKASNKQITIETAMRLEIPCPNTRTESEAIEEFIEKASFPIIIKPRKGTGSMGFHKFNNANEFWQFVNKNSIDVNNYVVQEFIDHEKRHGTYIMIDQNRDVKFSLASEVIRWYPIDAGTSTVSASVDDKVVIQYASKLLAEIGWKGFANIGFMIEKTTGKPILLEINGRIPAPVKLTWICGANVAKQLIEMAFDQEVTDYGENEKFGMMARHSQADFMWFIKSPNRFRAKPSWFSWKNTTDLVFWLDDPLPFIVYSFHAIFAYNTFMKKRRR